MNAVDARSGIDERRALFRVYLRQEPSDGTLHECRIRVIRITVRVSELHRFDDRMEIVRAGVSHPMKIELSRMLNVCSSTGPWLPNPCL